MEGGEGSSPPIFYTGKGPKAMKPKILIVDDEEGIRQLYTRFCWSLKYDTVLAAGGTQALKILNNHNLEFDAAIIDIHLGDMLGTELIALLKSLRPEMAVAATSAPYSSRVQACLRAGIDAFIEKPMEFHRFRAILAGLVRRTHTARSQAACLREMDLLLKERELSLAPQRPVLCPPTQPLPPKDAPVLSDEEFDALLNRHLPARPRTCVPVLSAA